MEDENRFTIDPNAPLLGSSSPVTFATQQPLEIHYQANVVSLQEQLSTLEQRVQELTLKLERQSLQKTEEDMSQFFQTGESNEIG